MINNERQHLGYKWDRTHSDDNYFDCGSNYTKDLTDRYGKFKWHKSEQHITSMGLKDGSFGKEHNEIKCFRDLEKEGADWNVLEIGCGYGGFGALIAPFVRNYDGVDISNRIVERGNVAIGECGIKNMNLTCVPECDLSYLADEKYDMIFTASVFIHVERPVTEHYLRETKRLLKGAGIFCHGFNLHPTNTHDNYCAKIYTIDDAENMLKDAGLSVLYRRDAEDFQPGYFQRYFSGMRQSS